MARLAFLVVLCVGIAAAKHFRFSKSEIAAFERMCKNENPDACTPHTEKANARRAQIKQVFTESLMGNGKKRSDAEAGAEEWLQKIQEAKQAVQRSMGLGSIQPYDDGLWQGDVLLTKEQAEEIIAEHSGKKTGKRSITRDTRRKWTSPIKYYIEPSVSSTSRAAIKKGIAQVQQQLGCIQFQELTSKPSGKQHMNFIMDAVGQAGCQGYAYIGYVGFAGYDNTVAVNIDADFCRGNSGCFANSIVVHEIFHSLGYSHEQCRFDRDKFIALNKTNVDPQFANNFDIDTTTEFNHYNQAYNYRSVMHYGNNVFAVDSRYPTMTAIPKSAANDALMGNSCQAQASDIAIGKGFYCASG